MLMRITGIGEISDVFSIFHDGIIDRCLRVDDDALMHIEIRYLAMRIKPEYTRFTICLNNVKDVAFRTWPSDLKSEPQVISDPNVIFLPKLEILESAAKSDLVTVACNQASPDFDYCGGELSFSATGARVTDQEGNQVSLDRLESICKGYWDEWRAKNQQQA